MELTPVRVLVAGSDGYIGQVLAPIHLEGQRRQHEAEPGDAD